MGYICYIFNNSNLCFKLKVIVLLYVLGDGFMAKKKKKILSAENIYFDEIRYIPLLSNEKIYELGMKSKEGDINAQLELFKAHLRFVPFIAKKFVKRVNHLFYLDLIQVGNMALWQSIQTYDPNKGLLTTYAGVAIERFIEYEIDKFEKEGSLPIYIQQAKRKYNYILKTEGEKTDEEWLEELKSYSIREDALDYVKSDKELEFTSINRLEDSGVDIEYLSSFEPDYASYIANKTANYELFIFLKDKLNPFEYYILYYSTLINEKKYRIKTASIFDVTYQAVCSKEKQVLKKVRHLINRKEKILKSIKER